MKQNDAIEGGSYLLRYFTQFPNILDEAALDPYEFRLLIHYYRVGNCWESIRTTARKCRMSIGKVSATRKILAEKGFIKMNFNEAGGATITVVNKASENIEMFDKENQPRWFYEDYQNALRFGIHGTVCVYCGSDKVGPLDHAFPKSRGGSNDDSNMRPCCHKCNTRKGQSSENEFIGKLISEGLLLSLKGSQREQVHHKDVLVHNANDASSSGEPKNNTLSKNTKKEDKASPPSMPDRKNQFAKSLEPFLQQYGKDMLNEFYIYWTESNDDGKKMKFEIERSRGGTFSIAGRLRTWKKNQEKFAPKQKFGPAPTPEIVSNPDTYRPA